MVDYDKGDNYYDADNSDGWHISLKYEGNNIMSVEITASSSDSNEDSKEFIGNAFKRCYRCC